MSMGVEDLIRQNLGDLAAASMVPGRVLAVDDDDGNLVVLEAVLSERYKVVTTTSPLQALKLATESEFDMVITDQRMPDMSGVDLLKAIREKWPETVRIVISAYSDVTAILQAINVGEVYRFILKPWNLDELMTVVKQGLEHRFHVLAIRKLADVLHQKNLSLQAAMDDLARTQSQLMHSARLAAVGQLTAGIGHELKGHMAGVQLLLQLLENANLPPEMAGYARTGRDTAQALLDLVGALNAFTKKGPTEVAPVPASVKDILDVSLRLIRTDPRAKARTIVVETPGNLPPVMADVNRMRQVLVNLARNAMDATGNGGRIGFRTGVQGGHVVLSVEDDGIGMTEEVKQRLFEPFYTTKESGLGLGLGICRQVVEALKGRLDVDSIPGKGTRVSVTLPVIDVGTTGA